MGTPTARVFYRIVESDPPTLTDFASRRARGLPPRGAEIRRPELHSGLSLYDTEAQARETARRFPTLGGLIAAVALPEGGPFRVEQTLRSGHHTAWGESRDFLAAVLSVVAVARVTRAKEDQHGDDL